MKKLIYGPVIRFALLVFSFLLILPASVTAQDTQVSICGTVVDQSGLPLPGAYVTAIGLQRGVSTDQDGKFELSVPQNATIAVSYVGFKTAEIPVGDRRVFEITLEEDALFLEDVVVIGYGVQRKSDVTGAIAKISTDDIENRSVARVEEALQGKTAGVQIITTSGAPGKGMDIRVRGISSNSGSVDPIILVDGLQVSDMGYLDPNNIESIEVLKDAASAAIYGAQAGNGVVLVTTRSGKRAGEGRIFYDFQYVLNDLAKVPDVMNASQYMDYMVEAGTFTQAEFDQKYDGVTDTNWANVAFETSLMQRHSLGFQGGGEKGSFFASINYLDQNGIVAGDADVYHRLTGQVNADYKIKKWLRVGMTSSIEKWDTRSVSESSE
ncbi:MAG: TonB-dependent receptor plug domain-containing protein, partial [Smithella sp.]|nr:TonB-dependent receptor plug domain-containing protein [Smithella sp.]